MLKFLAQWLSSISAALFVAALIGYEKFSSVLMGLVTISMAVILFYKGDKDGD